MKGQYDEAVSLVLCVIAQSIEEHDETFPEHAVKSWLCQRAKENILKVVADQDMSDEVRQQSLELCNYFLELVLIEMPPSSPH